MGLDEKGSGSLNLAITILGNSDGVKIEIYDNTSAQLFLQINMDAGTFIQAFSGRLAHTQVKGEFHGLSRVGKKMEMDRIAFPLPTSTTYENRHEIAKRLAITYVPDGWECDLYFNSQDSFFQKELRQYARCTIRRWVEPVTPAQ